MASSRLTLYTVASAAPIAAYALAPGTTALSTVVLVAISSFAIQLILSTYNRHTLGRTTGQLALLLVTLSFGSSLSFVLANPSAGSLFSSGADTFFVLAIYALCTSGIPLAGLLLGEPSEGGLGWLARFGGQVALDVEFAAAGVALSELAYSAFADPGVVEQERRDLLGEDGDGREENRDETMSRARRLSSYRKPFRLFCIVTLLALAGPLIPQPSFHPTYPSPADPSYTYPPLKVACVLPPSLTSRAHRKATKSGEWTLQEWIKETTIVAGRKVEVLSWSEGAIGLEKEGTGEEGWMGMGENEQDLLREVGKVADMYRVYILATYLVPPPASSSKHKLLNVATLVGPTSSSLTPLPHEQPFLVWSTTKQHPVPFVESYSHSGRLDPVLGSGAGVLPLAQVQLRHESHVPAPHLTPHQQLGVTGAICQDIAFPSLLGSFASPSSSSAQSRPKTPQLILNPSLTPLSSLSHAQVAQARLRAVEHNAFLLRCDGSTGASALIAPDGEIRAVSYGGEGGGSWEASIEVERANGRTPYERIWGGGRSRARSEGAVLLWLALTLVAVYAAEEGVAQNAAKRVEWRRLGGRMRERLTRAREAVAHLLPGHASHEAPSSGERSAEEGRLVEVD
ncbi:hypothetical protein JCM8097_001594 [Rhodosporidiobolus ruineniae]